MSYIDRVLNDLIKRYPLEVEFHQAVKESFESIEPLIESNSIYEKMSILERITEPDRSICFKVTWLDDNNNIHVNRAYRVQFNRSIGPYKGGLRFHPSVNLSIMKFLAYEQTFKNAITSLPIGGGKGGSDFDPKGKSDFEVMRFCQSFMSELFKYIGSSTDVPAGDIGVGAREVGYLFGQYKKLTNLHEGVLTGKDLSIDGLLGRKEATGYGLIYFTNHMLEHNNDSIENKTICISGAGNVAIHTAEKAIELGARVVTMSDSSGWIYDKNGINLEVVKKIKENRRERISKYVEFEPSAKYTSGAFDWSVPCDIALPCATQNELSLDSAKNLVKNGVKYVAEGANMPTTIDATKFLVSNGVIFGPAKAANAGGVSSSVIEMSQNSSKMHFNPEFSDEKLKFIMKSIFSDVAQVAEEFGDKNNYILGANILGFKRVSDAMISEGI